MFCSRSDVIVGGVPAPGDEGPGEVPASGRVRRGHDAHQHPLPARRHAGR